MILVRLHIPVFEAAAAFGAAVARLFVCVVCVLLCVGRGIGSRGHELVVVVSAVALGATAIFGLAVVVVLR